MRGGVGGGKGGAGLCSKIAPDRSETPSVIFRDSEWRRSTLHLALSGAPAARNFEELRDALTDDIIEEFERYRRAIEAATGEGQKSLSESQQNDDDNNGEKNKQGKEEVSKSIGGSTSLSSATPTSPTSTNLRGTSVSFDGITREMKESNSNKNNNNSSRDAFSRHGNKSPKNRIAQNVSLGFLRIRSPES